MSVSFHPGTGSGCYCEVTEGVGVNARTDPIAILCFFKLDEIDTNHTLFSCGGPVSLPTKQSSKITWDGTNKHFLFQAGSSNNLTDLTLSRSDLGKWFAVAVSYLGHNKQMVGYLKNISDNLATVSQTPIANALQNSNVGAACRIGAHTSSLGVGIMSGSIGPCLVWTGFSTNNMTQAEFDSIVSAILVNELSSSTTWGNAGLPDFHDDMNSTLGTKINTELTELGHFWVANTGQVITPKTGAGAKKPPILDIPVTYHFLRSGITDGYACNIRTTNSGDINPIRPTPRPWPYPYKAAVSLFHDNHSFLTYDQWIKLFTWLNTSSHVSPHGQGLNLECESSFWFTTNDDFDASVGQLNKFSYFEPSASFTLVNSADAPKIRQLMLDGVITTLHGYGDFGGESLTSPPNPQDYRMLFVSGNAASTITEIEVTHGLPFPKNWINHGDAFNDHNIGDKGDNSVEEEYHTDQTVNGTSPTVSGRVEYGWVESGLVTLLAQGVLTLDGLSAAMSFGSIADGRGLYKYNRTSPVRKLSGINTGAVSPAGYTRSTAQLVVPESVLHSGNYTWASGDAVLITSASTGQRGVAIINSVAFNTPDANHTTLTLSATSQSPVPFDDATDVIFDVYNTSFASPNSLWGIKDYFTDEILDYLEWAGFCQLVYCHLEYIDPAYTGESGIDSYSGYSDSERDLALAAMQKLATRNRAGTLWVPGMTRLLDYIRMVNQIKWTVSKSVVDGENQYVIDIDNTITDDDADRSHTFTAEQIQGLTFYANDADPDATYVIKLNGVAQPTVKNPADHTGRTSFMVPYQKLSSQFFENLGAGFIPQLYQT